MQEAGFIVNINWPSDLDSPGSDCNMVNIGACLVLIFTAAQCFSPTGASEGTTIEHGKLMDYPRLSARNKG